MEIEMIYGSEVTLESLYKLNLLGLEFVIEDGVIKDVLHG